jgi:hypothetical protein
MNRQERRAAKAMARATKVDRAVAVHEAGHAVARVLVAESLGWSTGEIISHVDIHPVPLAAGTPSFDGTHDLRSQATTYGQAFSRPMMDFLRGKIPTGGNANNETALSKSELVPLIAEMRAAGIDVDWWYRAKSVEAIFGPMAEAKLLGLPYETVWNSHAAENDLRDVVEYGVISGLSPERIDEFLNQNISLAERYMARPEVWRAVLALANSLRYGRTPGGAVTRTVLRELATAA